MKPSQPQSQLQNQHSINRLAQSIFVVNRHAKRLLILNIYTG